jgi:uncharacterized protein (DUF1015 family)
MQGKKTLIADGHHRYKTALEYKKKQGYDYVMAAFVNSENEGMTILPTNRVVDFNINIDEIPFKNYFEINDIKEKEIKNFPTKSFILAKKKSKYLLNLGQNNIYEALLEEEFRDLDVAILHKLVFEKILKIPHDEQKEPRIRYIKGNIQTMNAVNEENTAFFVNPPTLDQAFRIANAGKLMPQKSTYFYPKMFSGLVINKFDE